MLIAVLICVDLSLGQVYCGPRLHQYICKCTITMHLISTTSHRITHMTVQSFCVIHIVLYWTQDLTLFLEISVLIVEEVCRITNYILAIEISLKIPRMVYLTQNVTSGFYLSANLRDSKENLICQEG